MRKMKKYFLIAVTAFALASCSSDAYLGDNVEETKTSATNEIKFSFAGSNFQKDTHVGADAAGLLNKKFIVGGYKGAGTVVAGTTVFDNYLVEWTQNTAATTASNTSDWEYVGKTAPVVSGITGKTQSIKYWDYSAAQYDFIAYSVGSNTLVAGDATPAANEVAVATIAPSTATASATGAYTMKGTAEDLTECYIADMVTHYKSVTGQPKYQDEVQLTFRSLGTKVRVALYETVPGYSVKDVEFYHDATTKLNADISGNTSATLFTTGDAAANKFFPNGTMTVYFPNVGSSKVDNSDYNKAHVVFAGSGTAVQTKDFGALTANYTGKQYNETSASNVYLKRSSSTPTYAGATSPYYQTVLPNETGTILQLRVNYTLESIDGSGETIKVYGATAYVPQIYATWKPNYAYTYIFKISDNTNGWTSTANAVTNSDPAGLYPITFDAVVTEVQDGTQSTITTVASPSITTYQKGHDVSKDEYSAATGKIYVQVMADGTLKSDLDTKGKLYSVTARDGKTITEADVMDALNIQSASTTSTITGRNGWVLTDASTAASVSATITAIPGADGNDITVATKTAAEFTPSKGTYAYVYDTGTDNADTEYTTAVVLTAAPSDWNASDNVYYTDEGCTSKANTAYADGTYYQKYTNLNKVYGVKVIKVVD